jgi:hypothetical protein
MMNKNIKKISKISEIRILMSLISSTIPLVSFFIACSFLVMNYYNRGLPYYDSVGSYWNMFNIMNIVKSGEFLSGLTGSLNYSLSWLQSFFALATAHMFPAKPEYVIILNYLCLIVSMYSIKIFCLNLGMSKNKAGILSLLPLFPAASVSWVGGLIDMRRDFSYICLLCSGYFFTLIFYYNPGKKTAFATGILLALTQWSRGNALPYIMVIICPILIIFIFLLLRKRLNTKKYKAVIYGIISFLILAIPFYYFNLQSIFNKYVYGSWGIGQSRFESTKAFFGSLFLLLFGPGKNMLVYNLIFLLAAVFLIYFLRKSGIILVRFNCTKKTRFLLFSSSFVILLMFILNSLIFGIGKSGGIIPYLPVLIGFYSLVIYIATLTDVRFKRFNKVFNYWLIMFCVIILSIFRISSDMPTVNPKLKEQAESAASLFKQEGIDSNIAYLWLDHINVHDLNFYLTQQGSNPIRTNSVLSPGVDLEMPPVSGVSIPSQITALKNGIYLKKYIVISDDPSDYANPEGFFLFLKHGKDIVGEILNDKNMVELVNFRNGNKNMLLIRNDRLNQINYENN